MTVPANTTPSVSVLITLLLATLSLGGVSAARDGGSKSPDVQLATPRPTTPHKHPHPRRLSPSAKTALDRTGRTRVGEASFYASMFAGRAMADGTPMRPAGNNAASRTLPLGTTARVTNLETGKTAIVTIRDRGPYVDGRIVDLSPATAHQIGLSQRSGVARVKVSPIAVPMPDGRIKAGDGVLQASNRVALNAGG